MADFMKGYSENHMHSLFISPNCSLSAREMIYRKNYGVKTFKEIINKCMNNKHMLLKQGNWYIIIDFMLQNLASPQNHANKIHFLSRIKQWATNAARPQDEYKTIQFKSINIATYFQNPGCLEFFEGIGFIQVEGELKMIDKEEPGVINVAVAAITNRIKLLNMGKELGALWTNLIILLQKDNKYKHQPILNQISRRDVENQYDDYIWILNKLVKFQIFDRQLLLLEILKSFGFKLERFGNGSIFNCLGGIYDKVNKIERLKYCIAIMDYYKAQNDDVELVLGSLQNGNHNAQYYNHELKMTFEQIDHFPKLPKELTIQPQQINELQVQPVDLIPEEKNYFSEITNVKSIQDFGQILMSAPADDIKQKKDESKKDMYFQLLNPKNWEMLIDGIYENEGAVDRIKRLKTLINITEKASREARFRVIELSKIQTKQKLVNVKGAVLFLRGLGFKDAIYVNKPALRLFQVNSAISNVALRCLNYKVELVILLDGLQSLWEKIIQIMYAHPSFTKQFNLLDSIINMNFANIESYNKLLNTIKNAETKTSDPDELPIEIINELGLKLDIQRRNNKQLTTALLLHMKAIYSKINVIEQHKNGYGSINEILAEKRELVSMYSELNRLWFKVIELMQTDEIFTQQFYVLEKLINLDFTKQNDYDFILGKVIETGQKAVYSKEMLAAQQFIGSLEFIVLNDQFYSSKRNEILKSMIKILDKVEEIEKYKSNFSSHNKNVSVHLFRILTQDKYAEEFRNNEDNVVGNDNYKATAGFKIRHAPKIDDIAFRRRGAFASPKLKPQQSKRHRFASEHVVSDEMDSAKARKRFTSEHQISDDDKVNFLDLDPLALNSGFRCNRSIINCEYTDRVKASLKFYQTLGLNNICDQNKLVHYFEFNYKTLLDDHIHIKLHHDFELYLLAKEREILCEMEEECLSIQRLIGAGYGDGDGDGDEEFMFYRDTMDSIHCYMCHLEDIGIGKQTFGGTKGYETKYDDDDDDDDDKQDEKDEMLFVPPMLVKKKKSILLSKRNLNKFNIEQVKDESAGFIQGMCEHMVEKGMSEDEVYGIFYQLRWDEYDSDALLQDICDDNAQLSNIAQILENNQYLVIINYYTLTKIRDSSFSIGYRFYYWDYYKNQHSEEMEYFQNLNYHSGYKPHELYISFKYVDIKNEVLNNNQYRITLHQYNISFKKAKVYISTTQTTKQIHAQQNRFLHYDDIWDDQPLLLQHLLSVTLYCDWSDLCSAFSATFRKRKSFESIEITKSRNREYAHWSKRLRETVELYGKRGWETKKDMNKQEEAKWNQDNNRISGPFYCGMSTLMVMPQFNIRLCAPTSTTTELQIASNFTRDEGIIIKLNNNGHFHSDNLRIWDCSWISNYKGEDEKLIMGGFYTIRIQGIRTVSFKNKNLENQNFEKFFEPLFYYDCMLTGISMLKQKPIIKKQHKQILNNLINNNRVHHQYVHNTFNTYSKNKKQIVINLHQIHTYFNKLKHFIIETNGGTWDCIICGCKGMNINTSRCSFCQCITQNKVHGNNNILRCSIFDIFVNLNHIVIYTTSGTGNQEYVFDLEQFLTNLLNVFIIKSNDSNHLYNNDMTIEIKATHKYIYDPINKKEYKYVTNSWLSNKWEKSGIQLKQFLQIMNWNCQLKKTKNLGAKEYLEDTLLISVNNM